MVTDGSFHFDGIRQYNLLHLLFLEKFLKNYGERVLHWYWRMSRRLLFWIFRKVCVRKVLLLCGYPHFRLLLTNYGQDYGHWDKLWWEAYLLLLLSPMLYPEHDRYKNLFLQDYLLKRLKLCCRFVFLFHILVLLQVHWWHHIRFPISCRSVIIWVRPLAWFCMPLLCRYPCEELLYNWQLAKLKNHFPITK